MPKSLEELETKIEELETSLKSKDEEISDIKKQLDITNLLLTGHGHTGVETKRLVDLIKRSPYVDAKELRIAGTAISFDYSGTLTVIKSVNFAGEGSVTTCTITVVGGLITASTCE